MRSIFRFSSVSIPVGATIVSAKLQVRAYSNTSGTTCNFNVHFEAADSPSFPSDASDATGRTLGTAVAWNSVTAFTGGTWYDSPDLTEELQAVIDRAGWAENNAIQVHVLNNGSSTNAFRNVSTYNENSAYGVKLIVEYST